ncbi:MAG: hypothetical protein ACRD33_08825 [Candidatus Acidiferrales bacterium]
MLELFPAEQITIGPSTEALSFEQILVRRQNFLINMPLPRPVQLRKSGRYLPWLVYAALVVYIIVTFHTFLPVLRNSELAAPTQTWFTLIELAGIAIFCWAMFHGRSGEGDLLSSGAAAAASIKHQFNEGESGRSYIDYEFSDSHGHVWEKRTPDNFGGYSTGMTVVVFYDVDRPERQIADCSTQFYDIVLPDEK